MGEDGGRKPSSHSIESAFESYAFFHIFSMISRPQAKTVSILPATTPAAELTKAFPACYGSDVGTCDGVYDASRHAAGTVDRRCSLTI